MTILCSYAVEEAVSAEAYGEGGNSTLRFLPFRRADYWFDGLTTLSLSKGMSAVRMLPINLRLPAH